MLNEYKLNQTNTEEQKEKNLKKVPKGRNLLY